MSNNPHELSKRLASDLVALLNRFKSREQRHRQCIAYNNSIIARSEQLEQSIFIQDDINMFQKYHNQRRENEKSETNADQAMMQEYEIEQLEHEGLGVLLRKTLARSVEMAGYSIENTREPVDYYKWYFAKFKLICVRSTQDNILIKPFHAIRLISAYVTHRMQVELGRLAAIIHCLQMSDYDGLRGMHSKYYQTIHKSEHSRLPEPALKVPAAPKRSVSVRKESVSKSLLPTRTERQIGAERLIRRKPHKHTMKFMRKWVNSLNEVMEVVKDQLLEDITSDSKDWSARKMLNDLLVRNRANSAAINQFRQNETRMTEKKPVEQPKRQIVEEDDLIITVAEINLSTELQKQNKAVRVSEPVLAKRQIRQMRGERKRHSTIYSKTRPTMNNAEQAQLIREKLAQVTHKCSQEVPLPDSGREKLPEITPSGRASSVDSSKIIKTKEQVVQIKKPTVARVVQDNKIKWEVKTMGGNFFEEIGKRISKFVSMKQNK